MKTDLIVLPAALSLILLVSCLETSYASTTTENINIAGFDQANGASSLPAAQAVASDSNEASFFSLSDLVDYTAVYRQLYAEIETHSDLKAALPTTAWFFLSGMLGFLRFKKRKTPG